MKVLPIYFLLVILSVSVPLKSMNTVLDTKDLKRIIAKCERRWSYLEAKGPSYYGEFIKRFTQCKRHETIKKARKKAGLPPWSFGPDEFIGWQRFIDSKPVKKEDAAALAATLAKKTPK